MRLKKLEIYGFKSFAERTVMEFDDGITGVVGPNGSGKSNIADAVRWVLGEQSVKSLRGAKMEDVIFGGTEKRRALNYCEVSLVFDNEDGTLPVDFSEVMVTRRVYRSGESEYSLNKATCRLKDIIDMFRDTGIGREGYSLVGQGRIDEILSARSEDRRNVFEEAAGITKFKARRTEAQRRMEHTEQNLERIGDILEEIGSKLPHLEEQAKTARQYTLLSQELKVLEANIYLHRHGQLEKDIENGEKQLLELGEALKRIEEERTAQLVQSTLEEEAVQAFDEKINELTEEILSLTRAQQIHEGEAGVLRERIEGAKADVLRLETEEKNAESSAQEMTQQMGLEDVAINSILEEIEKLSLRYEQAEQSAQEKELTVQKFESDADIAKQQMIDSFNRLTDVTAVTARLNATKESLEKQLSAISQSGQGYESELEKAENELKAAQLLCEEAAQQMDEHKKELAAVSARHASILAEIAQGESNGQRIVGALREAQSRLKMLEQMRREYEGYQNSVREVLRRFADDQSVHGVVASLIQVPKELEKAIEMALGGAMQNIVCEKEEDAKRMIDVLRTNRLGRATFLPLSAVRGRVLSQQERRLLSMPGCIGVASELLSYDPKYKSIMDNLLGRTVIARDLDSGIAIMRSGNHAFRLVTLDGDMMHSGGSMTGGSTQSRGTSLLSRQREITEYKAAIAKLEQRQIDHDKLLEDLRAKQVDLSVQLKALNDRIHEDDLDNLRANSSLEGARQAQMDAKQQIESFLLEKERMLDSIRQIDTELSSISHAAGEAESLSTNTQADIAALNEKTRLAREELEQIRNDLSAMLAERAGLEARLESAKREKERGERSIGQLGQAKLIRERAKGGLLARIETDTSALNESMRSAESARVQLEAQQSVLDDTRAQRQERQQRLRNIQEHLNQSMEELETLRDKHRRLESRLERLRDEYRLIQDRIWERHELTYALAKELEVDDFDNAAAKSRSEAIRLEIRQMGMVNLAAVQEYAESKERFDDLSRQSNDLEKAKKDLEKIIEDLTREMETRFVSQFRLINESFSKTFARLFEGGTAILRLQDDRDPLNCGIDIVAQPPGKKLQLLSLLSGGERALTAIALLFSMLTIRPSPFCILDEIEAALDEANVEGFAKYLEDYAKNTQFIVITHRKGTMEHCNTLYGVAMEEKGISRMVSVQLGDIGSDLEDEAS